MARTSSGLTHTHTETHTDRQTTGTTTPESQNWPRVKTAMFYVMIGIAFLSIFNEIDHTDIRWINQNYTFAK